MNKLNFLLWNSSDKSSSKLIEFGKRAAKNIETKINANKGIGGIPIKIFYEDIPHKAAGADEIAQNFYEELVNNKNILFARGPGTFAGTGKAKFSNIKKIASPERLLFNNTSLSTDEDLPSMNVFDLRSNALSNPNNSFHENINNLRNLTTKQKVFHIANFVSTSPIYLAKEELQNQDIFLFKIDKERHHNREFLKEDIEIFLANSSSDDLINFGAMPLTIKPLLFEILKNYDEERFITLATDGNAKISYKEIKNTILVKEDANYDIYLSMEGFFEEIALDMSIKQKQACNRMFDQFEIPLLIKYVADKNNLKFKDTKSFIFEISQCLNLINGKRDIYLGLSKDFTFNNNQNSLQSSALTKISSPLISSSENAVKTMYKNQLSIEDNKDKISQVISFNIDVQRITNVSIEEGTYGAELFLDITSPALNPINSIKFNNLSSVNPKFESRKLEYKESSGLHSSRYLITANFDFKPIGSNYPFDNQFLYISVSPTEDIYIVQPVPEEYLDKEFTIEGWTLVDAKCGINRKKSWVALSEDLSRVPRINQEVRIGWELQRANSMTLLKIGIPLSFLFILVYYTLYLPAAESSTALGYLTTAFLSSIALYFSTERPQPLSMTTIDVVFAFFYIISGASLLMLIFSEFNPELYEFFIYPLRLLLPVSIIGLGLFIKARLRSVKYKPSITK